MKRGQAPPANYRRRRLVASLIILACLAITAAGLVSCAEQAKEAGSVTGIETSGASNRGTVVREGSFKPLHGSYRGAVPILMYHVIKAPAAGVAYRDLWTPAETFKATIKALKSAGFNGVTMAQVHDAWRGGQGLPDRPIVISFDDGYLSHFATAMPVLASAGWPGVLNLEGKNIGKGGLTVQQLEAMIASGWEIGAHSLTHPDLTTVGLDQLEREVAGSRRVIERKLHVKVGTFCYPAGRNDAVVQAAVRRAGYLSATTVDPGIAAPTDNQFALPRVRINGSDSPQTVLARVHSGRGAAGSWGR